jgi:phenylpyruvate tautomerase PptA (4-oxalocrotonate tautomerase family)
MPLYRCTCPEGRLTDAQRERIAVAFTDIHCELTGAPRTFVHAQFHHRAARPGHPEFELHAGIRAGRDDVLARRLISRCIEAVAQIANLPSDQIAMRTSSTPASWILEGGRVLPEPGEEDDWLAAHPHPEQPA